jgi:hypothetical protein
MSIVTLRESLKDLPGSHAMTMNYRYIDGVAHELFKIGEREALVKSPVSPEQIREAFAAAGLT